MDSVDQLKKVEEFLNNCNLNQLQRKLDQTPITDKVNWQFFIFWVLAHRDGSPEEKEKVQLILDNQTKQNSQAA